MKRRLPNTGPAPINESRRWFLGSAAGLGVAGVRLATLGGQAAVPEATETPAERRHAGYHETDHIRSYYRSAW